MCCVSEVSWPCQLQQAQGVGAGCALESASWSATRVACAEDASQHGNANSIDANAAHAIVHADPLQAPANIKIDIETPPTGDEEPVPKTSLTLKLAGAEKPPVSKDVLMSEVTAEVRTALGRKILTDVEFDLAKPDNQVTTSTHEKGR